MGLTGPVQSNDIVMRASEIGSTIPGIASLAMKTARKGAQRGVQGIYQLPSGQEPTPEYMNVAQQSLNNQTQQMTDMLNSMAPEDERLAYINEEEAGILKLLGGSGDMTPQGIPSFENASGNNPDLPVGQRGRKRYHPTTHGLPEGQGQNEIYRAYMDQLPADNAARQQYFRTGNPTLPQTPTVDKDKETGEEGSGSGAGSGNTVMPDPSDRFERGGPETGGTETGDSSISLPYIPGDPKDDFRTADFRDYNNNGIDDRDEQPMGGSGYFDYMKYISGPKQAAAELAVTAPEGEFPAYINEDEAELLRMYGGSGTTSNNPAEIPSFINKNQDMSENEQRRFGIDKNLLKTEVPKFYGAGEHKVKLAYITEPEAEILKELDLYDSNPPHEGPGGIPNYNDSGGRVGGGRRGGGQDQGAGATGSGSVGHSTSGTGTGTGTGSGSGNDGTYSGPTARDLDADGLADVDQDPDTRARAERNAEIVKAKATIKAGGGLLTDGEGGLVAAGRALDKHREQVAREAYAESLIDKTQGLASLGVSRDAAYAATGMPTAIGLQDASYGSFTDRQQELQDKARANTITNSELQELASFNEFAGENPTTGMGIVESLRYQATRPDLGEDLAGLGNVLGLISGNPIKMGISALKMYKSTKPKEINTVEERRKAAAKKKGFAGTIGDVMKGLTSAGKLSAILGSNASLGMKALYGGVNALNINDSIYGLSSGNIGYNTEGLFNSSIDAAKDKFKGLFGGQDNSNNQYADLPDNYGGGNFGNDRGNNGGDPFIYTGNEETEEEKQIARDKFERAFAQRYFIGPTTLPEVRKYAVTGGGYNQLTPYGIG